MLTQQTRIGIQITALLTALVGIVNLFSAITPNLPQRAEWLEQFIPFDIRAGGHFFAAVAGFVMLILATNLLRRKRVAWLLTVSMLVVSILSHLIKGLDYEESLLALILLIQLLLMRSVFTAQSDRPSIAQGVQVLIIALLFTLAYGTLGFFLLDGEYSTRFDFPEALLQTLAMFFTADNAGLEPTTQFGRFFADSIYSVGAITIAIALFLILRPVLLRGEAATISQRQQARQIVEQYGRSSLARFALFDDKAYYFSPSKCSVIAYVPKGRGATALGDPIGPSEDRKEAIASFHQYCQRNDWFLAFYQTLPDDLELYKSLGFQVVTIGQEAIVDLKTFSLQGKAGKNLRTALNRFNRLGYEIKFYKPPIPQSLLQELRVISNEWLQMMQGSEKKFSLGWFDDDYLRECEIAVVRTKGGAASAFANVVPAYQLNEVTIDLMRRCK